jgi:hypothetical protein
MEHFVIFRSCAGTAERIKWWQVFISVAGGLLLPWLGLIAALA